MLQEIKTSYVKANQSPIAHAIRENRIEPIKREYKVNTNGKDNCASKSIKCSKYDELYGKEYIVSQYGLSGLSSGIVRTILKDDGMGYHGITAIEEVVMKDVYQSHTFKHILMIPNTLNIIKQCVAKGVDFKTHSGYGTFSMIKTLDGKEWYSDEPLINMDEVFGDDLWLVLPNQSKDALVTTDTSKKRLDLMLELIQRKEDVLAGVDVDDPNNSYGVGDAVSLLSIATSVMRLL